MYSSWWSALLFALAFLASQQLALRVDEQEEQLVVRESAAATAAAIAVLRTSIEGSASACERLADRVRSSDGDKPVAIPLEAGALVERHTGLRAVVWVDDGGRALLVAADAEEAATPYRARREAWRTLQVRAGESDGWFVAAVDGELVTVHPLGERGVFVGVVESDAALAGLSALSFPGRNIRVAVGGETLFARFLDHASDADRWGVSGPLGLPGDAVWVTTWPGNAVLAQAKRHAGRAVRWGGLLAAALLGGLVFAGQRAGIAELRARAEAEQRRATEAELRELNDDLDALVRERTRELARSNRDLEQFAYAASHDLQEPLRMVTAYLQLLDERYAAQLDERAREYIAFAVDGAGRMRDLVRGLLALSRVERKAQPFERVELGDAVRDALQSLKVLTAERGATFEVATLPAVAGDEAQLSQVFQNLFANAIRYSSGAPRVVVTASRGEEGVTVDVRDHGCGIPIEQRERVFEVFQRLHTQNEVAGTGLGLALCQRIMERHGGRIEVVDTDGPGTTIRLTFRAQSTDRSASASA